MKIDSTTWCSENNVAGKYLADTLSNICDDKLTQNVSTYFHRFNVRMKALNCMEKGLRCFYLELLFTKTKNDIRKNFRHKLVQSLMLNVLSSIYRNELNKIHPL